MFLARSLNVGGAERQLLTLARGLSGRNFEVAVATFYSEDRLRQQDADLATVPVVSLGKRGRWDIGAFTYRLRRALRGWRPDVLQCYLTEPNILGLMAGRLAGVRPVVWGIRSADVDYSYYDPVTAWSFRLSVALSGLADHIVVNSETGKRHHIARGFAADRITVIPNGIDVDRFHPDRAAGLGLRGELGVKPDERLVGLVARFDPAKDHATFLRAAARLSSTDPRVKFLCVGDGPLRYRRSLSSLLEELGVGPHVLWAGERSDMGAIYNALDVACLSSAFAEGFPNVVGEAMACETPCVVTDVGDAPLIVGDTGLVVPRAAPDRLADAWRRLLRLDPAGRAALGRKARQRIVELFDVGRLVDSTAGLYTQLLQGERKRAYR